MRMGICAVALIVLALAALPRTSEAVPEFRARFLRKYTDQSQPRDPWTAKVNRAKCTVCHAGPRTKRLNIYGFRLSRYLDADQHRQDTERIDRALDVVFRQQVDPEDPLSTTFGGRMRRGLLPATGK